MLSDWLAVAVGGMLGSLARFGLLQVFGALDAKYLPYATLTANVLGCFAMGVVSQLAVQHWDSRAWWVIGLRVGLLGGLTTFSSFALDVIRPWQLGRPWDALALLVAHCGLGLLALLVGISATQRLAS